MPKTTQLKTKATQNNNKAVADVTLSPTLIQSEHFNRTRTEHNPSPSKSRRESKRAELKLKDTRPAFPDA